MNKTAICSIASKNYFSHAKTLFASVKKLHGDIDLHFLLADEIDGEFEAKSELFEIIQAKDLGIKEFRAMSFMYDIIELNVALKPFFIKYLLRKGYEKIIYFDVDIMVFNKLDLIIDLLDTHSIVITPHITQPILDEENFNIKEQSFLKNGAYNAGFIAVSKTETTSAFLDWWERKCATTCFREPETGLFVDQKWLGFGSRLFNSISILRHLGCNVSYWNLHERELRGLRVNNDVPLIFFHFSGVDIEKINQISKYQNKYTLDTRKDLLELFETYKNNVIENGYYQSKTWVYKYGEYDNGVKIGLLSRRLYSSVSNEYENPFSCEKESYYSLLKKQNLIEKQDGLPAALTQDRRKKVLFNKILKFMKNLLGPDRYNAVLMYLRYISVIRRQDFLLK